MSSHISRADFIKDELFFVYYVISSIAQNTRERQDKICYGNNHFGGIHFLSGEKIVAQFRIESIKQVNASFWT